MIALRTSLRKTARNNIATITPYGVFRAKMTGKGAIREPLELWHPKLVEFGKKRCVVELNCFAPDHIIVYDTDYPTIPRAEIPQYELIRVTTSYQTVIHGGFLIQEPHERPFVQPLGRIADGYPPDFSSDVLFLRISPKIEERTVVVLQEAEIAHIGASHVFTQRGDVIDFIVCAPFGGDDGQLRLDL